MFEKIIYLTIKDKNLLIIWLLCTLLVGTLYSLDESSPLISKLIGIQALTLAKALSSSVLIAMAFMFSCIVYIFKLSNRANPDDYEIYHPNIGITVYRIPEKSSKFDPDIWYCPHCLLVNRKLSYLTPDSEKQTKTKCGWSCHECGNVV